MRIGFVADLHLNINNRLDDFKRSLDQVREGTSTCDRVIVLGDIYHFRKPHPVEQKIFRIWLNSIKCEKWIVIGNHDRNLDTHTLNEFEIFGGAKIINPPHIFEEDGRRIYIGHEQVQGAKLGPSNLDLNIKSATPLEQLAKAKCDLYVLGHVHKMQAVVKVPLVLYVGSIERIDFGERNEDKYFMILDTKAWKIEWKKLNIRPMVQLEVDASKQEEILPQPEGAITKVVIKGTKEQIAKYNEGPLKEQLVKTFRYNIIYNIIKDNKIRNRDITETRTTEQSFEEYGRQNNFTSEELKKGLEVISEHKTNSST